MPLESSESELRRPWFAPLNPLALWLVLAAGVALRLLFCFRWAGITPDSVLYADIAKSWLQHGVYGLSGSQGPDPTYIRLPGYPAFLAIVFAVAGPDHFNAVRFVQTAVDLVTCFIVADLARRALSARAAGIAFVLCALGPFFANYAAFPLTETLSIFAAALALDALVAGLQGRSWKPWIVCGLANAVAILLRPDGGALLIAIGVYLLWRAVRLGEWRRLFTRGVLVAVLAFAPLVPWTLRNWRVFHEFQPLAPHSAAAPDEFAARGFPRWERTWEVDYANLTDIGFQVDGGPLDFHALPPRACDSRAQCDDTERLFAQYNLTLKMTAPVDAGFAAIADARIRHAPLRYYVLLPIARALDIWLRPRTELLPVDAHFWQPEQGWDDFTISTAVGVLNLLYLFAGAVGVVVASPRYGGALLVFCAVRTAVVTAFAGPEPRYVLECFPAVMVYGAAGIAWFLARRRGEKPTRDSS